jgi:PAS domain S-box-containing protein
MPPRTLLPLLALLPRVATALRPDLSGVPGASAAHLRRIERLVWGVVAGYVASFAALDAAIGRWAPPRWRQPVRLGALALSSVVTTTALNRVALSRSAAFTRQLEADREALRRSEARLRAVVENAPVVLFATDPEGRFTLAEGKGLEALGFCPGGGSGGGGGGGGAVGQSVFDVYRDVPQILDNMRRALAGESFTASVNVGDRTYEAHYEPLRDDGRVIGVVGVATDVTERVRAERALRESEARFRTLVHESADSVLVLVDGLTIAFANPAAAALHGVAAPGELVGRSLAEFLVPEDAVAARQRAATRQRGEDVPAKITVRVRRPDGSEVAVEGAASRIQYQGRPASLVVSRDVSDRLRLAEETRERTRLDGALLVARTVAHEINNALSPVAGFAELLALRPEVARDPQAASYVRLIREAAMDVTAKVRRLQAIVRLQEQSALAGAGMPVLDLERSTAVGSAAAAGS